MKKPSAAEKLFESLLWNFRYVVLVAVFSLMLSSLIAFGVGIHSVVKAYSELAYTDGDISSNTIILYLVSAIDEFLLGIILIIISIGIYELFISRIEVIGQKNVPFPGWLTFKSFEELKAVLTKVIIIILMVYFFKSVVSQPFDTPLDTLYLGVGIGLVALANYLSHKK